MLAILTTHPIQYQTPIWKELAQRGRVPFRVFYMSRQGARLAYDPGFGRDVAWDVDLLAGYDHEFLDVQEGPDQSSFGWLKLTRAATERLTGADIEALWIQGWQVLAYWQAVWSASRRGVPIWLRAETNSRSTSGGWRGALKRPLMAQLFRRVDRFLTIGEANRRFYLGQGIEPDRLSEAPYCVDNDRFSDQAAQWRDQRSELRARWGIAGDACCILFVGKLIAKKRPSDVLSAVARLQSRRPEWPLHVLFVGTGELDADLRRRSLAVFDEASGGAEAEPRNNPGGVKSSFAGFLNQSELAKAYVAADCLVLPSDSTETWGLVANEAMACGLPVVVSDACGCSDDLVGPHWPSLSFPVGDIEALSKAIEVCLDRPPDPSEIRKIIGRYDVKRTVQTVEHLYLSEVRSGKLSARAA